MVSRRTRGQLSWVNIQRISKFRGEIRSHIGQKKKVIKESEVFFSFAHRPGWNSTRIRGPLCCEWRKFEFPALARHYSCSPKSDDTLLDEALWLLDEVFSIKWITKWFAFFLSLHKHLIESKVVRRLYIRMRLQWPSWRQVKLYFTMSA